MRRTLNFRKSKGFTLVELSIALIVIVVGGIFIAKALTGLWNGWRGSNEAQNASTLTQVVKKQAPNGSFGTGSLSAAIAPDITGVYTNVGTLAAPSFKNHFGGPVTATGNGATASITDGALPPGACKETILNLSSTFTDAVITAGSTSWPAATQVTAAQAAAACTASLTDVSWVVQATN
ncbi:type II secretion system protein [Dyella ginsengisoli]|jgi:prepilin-type N-terminal cleavage/methylation domain-containing protein|uniref:type II secretion system protein n=1 Tax=Dyella ginsengisoli TaxID=363848 RepID=UPI000346C028|nr:prepilin-type N-terminal cleavage/methylation domain-containing protein [Dyella ginsengisoli]